MRIASRIQLASSALLRDSMLGTTGAIVHEHRKRSVSSERLFSVCFQISLNTQQACSRKHIVRTVLRREADGRPPGTCGMANVRPPASQPCRSTQERLPAGGLSAPSLPSFARADLALAASADPTLAYSPSRA